MISEPPPPSANPEPPIRSRISIPGRGGWALRASIALISRVLRFAFHLLYYPLAFTYDAVAWIVSAGEWAEWRRCVIPHLLPGPVLEIAHGTGTLALDMAEGGYAVTAVDLSPAMGRIARGKKRRWLARRPSGGDNPSAGPAFIRADTGGLPFRADYFSSATATFPADFLFEPATFRSVHRVLRPGGRWIILLTAFPEWFAQRLLPQEDSRVLGGMSGPLIRALGDCGFSVRIEIVRRPRSRVLLILAQKRQET
ncbi:MAG: methyltransferase domain-containing protein [Anaerolineales bacterium]|nr:methyltransferase domain-containing protein [Anaerolineales bacterium]